MTAMLTFVDTNVLGYALDTRDPAKQAKATTFLKRLWADRTGVVSTQILNELYGVLTHKMGLAPIDARTAVLPYTQWHVVEIDVAMIAAAMLRHEQDGLSWWDCLIVEAALRAGATRLASEDFQAGRRFDRVLEVTDPMAA